MIAEKLQKLRFELKGWKRRLLTGGTFISS